MYGKTDKAFATAYYHWFFLIQPFDLPERLIGSDPQYYLRKKTGGWGSAGNIFDPRAFAEYERCFRIPRRFTRRARIIARRRRSTSSTTTPMSPPAARCRVRCSRCGASNGVVQRCFDPLADWRAVASDVRGRALPSGHYLAEEVPEETLAELRAFFIA